MQKRNKSKNLVANFKCHGNSFNNKLFKYFNYNAETMALNYRI